MPASPEQLVAAYHRRLNDIRAAVAARIAAIWTASAGLTDTSAAAFSEAAALASLAAQTRTAVLVDAYIATYLQLLTGERATTTLDREAVTGAAVRNGADPVDVYRRSIITARRLASDGTDYAKAMAGGRARAVAAAETDVMLTNRAAATQAMAASPHVVGYQRVLTGNSCMFCAAASSRLYHTNQLQPIHAHCDCGIAPVIGTTNPGAVINHKLLSDLKADGGPSYWKERGFGVDANGVIRHRVETTPPGADRPVFQLGEPLDVAVRDHGELGPLLVDRADHFTGASAL